MLHVHVAYSYFGTKYNTRAKEISSSGVPKRFNFQTLVERRHLAVGVAPLKTVAKTEGGRPVLFKPRLPIYTVKLIKKCNVQLFCHPFSAAINVYHSKLKLVSCKVSLNNSLFLG